MIASHILRLHLAGRSLGEIARQTGLSTKAVRRILGQRHRRFQLPKNKPKHHRPNRTQLKRMQEARHENNE